MSEPQWEACKVCGGDHWTTHHGHDPRSHQTEPTTAAGRAVLRSSRLPQADAILAIEAEARAAAPG